jgi:hypothetical protein
MKKIIIFGQNRSGTKFLTNLIADKFDLACIQSDEHGGVIESNIHSYYANQYPNKLSDADKNNILLSLAKEYTFTRSGLEIEDLNNLSWDTCIELFIEFYSLNASKLKSEGWVQKVSSNYLDDFLNKNVKIIIIQRHSLKILRSSIKAFDLNFIQGFRLLFFINLLQKYEKYIAKNKSVLLFKYEELLISQEVVISTIEKEIHCSVKKNNNVIRFNNSSFKVGNKKKNIPYIYILMDCTIKIFVFIVPPFVIRWLNNYNLRNRRLKNLVTNSLDTSIINK